MIVMGHLGGLFCKDVGTSLFNALVSVYPEGQTGSAGHAFRVSLPRDDERYGKIVTLLTNAGLRRWDDRSQARNRRLEYKESWQRVYDDSDYSACRFLELAPRQWLRDFALLPGNRLGLPVQGFPYGSSFPRGAQFVSPFLTSMRVAVSRAAHDRLLACHLDGLIFRDTVPVAGSGVTWKELEWKEVGDPYYEITSDRTMPPLSPSVTLVDLRSDPVAPGYTGGEWGARDGIYTTAELHYRAEDVAGFHDLDVALTCEGDEAHKGVIVSKRFYECCKTHGLKTEFIPVRLDE